MHDEVAVCLLHAIADLAEQPQARGDVECVAIAVVCQCQSAGNMFHRQPRDAGGRATTIQDARDIGVREPRQQCAFVLEASHQLRAEASIGAEVQWPDQLHRHLLLIGVVGTPGQEDHAHAATVDAINQLVVANPLAELRETVGFRWRGRFFKESAQVRFRLQQAQHTQVQPWR